MIAGALLGIGVAVGPADLRKAVAGRTVLVTGGSAGIGAVTARRLADGGATVLLVARGQDRLRAKAAEIEAAGGRAHALPADLGESDQVDGLADEILERFGGVDVIVNNAGHSIRRSIGLSTNRAHDFERTIAINYLGPVRLLLALLPEMRGRGDSQIVNVSTVGVQVPAPRYAAYLASKAAFDVWLRCLAPEVRGDGVATTSVYLPLVHTGMSAPTRLYRHVPGMSVDKAAELICRAVVSRPATIAPWWARVGELAYDAARTPFEYALGIAYRATTDSARARGEADDGRIELDLSALPVVGRLAAAVAGVRS